MQKKNNVLIVIPSRLASTRIKEKAIAEIEGKTMIQRVYEQSVKSESGKVCVACCGDKIADNVKSFNGNYIITDPKLQSGTDRVYAAMKQIDNYQKYDFIVNVQGDLPTIDPKIISDTVNAAIELNADITTPASIITNKSKINNNGVVKIAATIANNSKAGNAIYFSRSAIPYNSDVYYDHIGIYVYKREILEKFVSLPPSKLEKNESLEQLRAIENDIKITLIIVDSSPVSVDLQEDLEEARAFVKNNN